MKDQMDGYGQYIMNNGRVYEGMWKEGKRHGKGTFKWEDGRIYDGRSYKGNISWTNNMGKGFLNGQMAGNTRGIGRMGDSMAGGFTLIGRGDDLINCGEMARLLSMMLWRNKIIHRV